MSTMILLAIILFFLGLTFGSFANAAAWRIGNGRGRTLLTGRSECTHCKHPLAWYDLVPVLSWLSLSGKCRYCGGRIDDTPVAELGLAGYFLVSFLLWPGGFGSALAVADFVFWLVYGVFLMILALIDRRKMILPDVLTYPLIGLAAVNVAVRAALSMEGAPAVIAGAVLAVLAIAGVYLVLYAVSRGRWVGFGDVKLSVFIGLALGDWRLSLLTFFLANLFGCLVILPGLLSKKLTRTSKVPFGPFLILGFAVSGLVGARIVGWYMAGLYL